jgi:post-segregation antitoxin (ccd killing protein)
MKAFDVPTSEELIQKNKATEVNMSRGSGTSVKISER